MVRDGDKAAVDALYLVRCALRNTVPVRTYVDQMDLDEVLRVSREHLLTAACATALEACGIRDESFIQDKSKALRKMALMDIERKELFRKLDEAGIWHVPLKGCVLQSLWPAYGMRQMSDNDILIDPARAGQAHDIMIAQGFTSHHFGRGAHDVYFKAPVCNFELHRALFTAVAEKKFVYYKDPTRLLVPDGDGTLGYHMRDEDFYVYLVAHDYKHFMSGGIGLRTLADAYVWLGCKGEDMDWAYVTDQLDQLGIAEFESCRRHLACALFADGELTDEGLEMLAYMIDSTAYGTQAHSVQNQIGRFGRAGFVLFKTFPPFRLMVTLYPVLRRAPVLLPALWAWRLVNSLMVKPDRVAYQVRAVLGLKNDE